MYGVQAVVREYSCDRPVALHDLRQLHVGQSSQRSFTYLGSGLKDTNKRPTTSSLVHDTSGNHPDNAWQNVMYIDGHVSGKKPSF